MKKFGTSLFAGIVGVFMLTMLSSCGGTKLSCESNLTQHLTKQLVAKYKIIPLIFGGVYENTLLQDYSYEQAYIGACKNNTNANGCKTALNVYNQLNEFYYENADDNIHMERVFQDGEDKKAKTVTCHAEIFAKNFKKDKFIDVGTAYYRVQLTTDENAEEVYFTDFDFAK